MIICHPIVGVLGRNVDCQVNEEWSVCHQSDVKMCGRQRQITWSARTSKSLDHVQVVA